MDLASEVFKEWGIVGLTVLGIVAALAWLSRKGVGQTLRRVRRGAEQDDELREKIHTVKATLQTDLNDLEMGLHNHVGEVRRRLHGEIEQLEQDMQERMTTQQKEQRAWAEEEFAKESEVDRVRQKVETLAEDQKKGFEGLKASQQSMKQHLSARFEDFKENLRILLKSQIDKS